MVKYLSRFLALIPVALTAVEPAHAFLITDVTGDGVAVTVNGLDGIACSANQQIKVVIEGMLTNPGDDFFGITFRLLADDPPLPETVLLQVHIPASTIDAIPPPIGFPPPPPTGAFYLWFNLHCDDRCHVEGRFGDVGSPSSFVYIQPGGPPGPTFSIGSIGGGGGPLDAGIPIEAAGSSGTTCATLAIETNSGTNFTGGANEVCCAGVTPRPVPPTMVVGKNAPDLIDVYYDVLTCTASEHALFFGGLGSFTQVTSAECLIGAAGIYTTTPPPGDVWFLVAGREGDLYSSIGQSSAGERVLVGVDDLCAGLVSDPSGTCP